MNIIRIGKCNEGTIAQRKYRKESLSVSLAHNVRILVFYIYNYEHLHAMNSKHLCTVSLSKLTFIIVKKTRY